MFKTCSTVGWTCRLRNYESNTTWMDQIGVKTKILWQNKISGKSVNKENVFWIKQRNSTLLERENIFCEYVIDCGFYLYNIEGPFSKISRWKGTVRSKLLDLRWTAQIRIGEGKRVTSCRNSAKRGGWSWSAMKTSPAIVKTALVAMN